MVVVAVVVGPVGALTPRIGQEALVAVLRGAVEDEEGVEGVATQADGERRRLPGAPRGGVCLVVSGHRRSPVTHSFDRQVFFLISSCPDAPSLLQNDPVRPFNCSDNTTPS